MTTFHPAGVTPEDDTAELRRLALARLRKKRDLQAHLLAYVLVNLFLNGIWLFTTPGGFYWPMFPLLGWGIGLAFHVWDVYAPENPPEDAVQREMHRLSGH
ncbi:2TM domain-containing protein [Actinoplanes sp. NPDC049548]|uniref:2TM domain-containing protein n=1 Tax=Actinoplanes sp. NPDC049548 TaxID=3155152 RepID=UPI003429A544